MNEIREIIGNTIATPTPQPDWNQTDETKLDYIKNKPIENGEGKGSIVNSATDEYYQPIVDGVQSVAFGGFRSDKVGKSEPDDEDNITTIYEGADQSYAFGAGHDVHGMWNFVAGKDGTSWQRSAMVLGNGCTAGDESGNQNAYSGALATGIGTKATGYGAFSAGSETQATGKSAAAINNTTKASGDNSFAAGYNTEAKRENQAVFGYYNAEAPDALLVVGGGGPNSRRNLLEVRTDNSIVIGPNTNNARQGYVYVSGGKNIIGEAATYAFAHGNNLTVNNWNQTTFGHFNDSDSTAQFMIGNGGSEISRSNAFEVYHDGHVVAGRSTKDTDSDKTLVTKDYMTATMDNRLSDIIGSAQEEADVRSRTTIREIIPNEHGVFPIREAGTYNIHIEWTESSEEEDQDIYNMFEMFLVKDDGSTIAPSILSKNDINEKYYDGEFYVPITIEKQGVVGIMVDAMAARTKSVSITTTNSFSSSMNRQLSEIKDNLINADLSAELSALREEVESITAVGGTNGADGKNGSTFIPHVSADGVLSWTNDGGLENPDPVNIVGDVEGALLYTAQTLTEDQKAQARANIGVDASGAPIDSTLTQSGIAADAGAVGSLLMTDVDLSNIPLVNGYIHGSNGAFYSSSSCMSTDFIDIGDFGGSILYITSYINGNCGFSIYDKNKAYLCGADGNTSGFTPNSKKPQAVTYDIPDNAYYVRFTLMSSGVIDNYPMSIQIKNVIHTTNTIVNNAISNGKTRNIDLSNVKVVNAYVRGSTGEILNSTSYLATDFIAIPGTENATIIFKSMLAGNCGFAFYDKNESFIYGVDGNTDGVTSDSKQGQVVTCVVPNGAYYIRFTMKSNENTSTYPMSVEYADLATFAESISKEVASDDTTRLKTFCLVNPAVKAYMDEVTYPDDDYSYSCMYSDPVVEGRNYGARQLYRADRPLPVFIKWPKDDYAVGVNILLTTSANMPYGGPTSVIYHAKFGVDRFPIYNLLPNTTYYYKVTALYADGTEKVLINKDSFKTTEDHLRMIYADGCGNIRDLGGWSTYDASGNKTGTVKYGRLFRGSAIDGECYYYSHITDDGVCELMKYVGIEVEVDLREGTHRYSDSPIAKDLKTEDNYLCVDYQAYTSVFTDAGKSATRTAFNFILRKLNESNPQKSRLGCKPVYYHCLGGADRTGTLTYLLLGVLGVSESDLAKDYELTSFSIQGNRLRHSSTYGFPSFITQLKTYDGDTLQAKIENFLLECGIKSEDIVSFKEKMIETI